MFHDQSALARSWYQQALFNYTEACDAIAELYSEGKLPDTAALIATGLRFKNAFDKLHSVVKIANHKFGTNFTMPHLVVDTKYWEKPQ